MNELKDSLRMKPFIINPGIIKNISKIDITLDEFILLLYFINIENKLNLQDINKYTDFDNGHILELFNSLIGKGLIELKVIEIAQNKHDEEISLEVFYDKLIMNSKEDSKVDEKISLDLFQKFEQEFGRTLSPVEYKVIEEWLNKGIKEDLIEEALKEAVLSGVTTLRYIEAIIREWTKNGGKRPLRKKETNEEKEYNELFDYDWLDEE